jgi:hypothetical protein
MGALKALGSGRGVLGREPLDTTKTKMEREDLCATSNGGGRVRAPGVKQSKPQGLKCEHILEAQGWWQMGSRNKTGRLQ